MPITTEVDLIGNLHNQLQKLNDFIFSDMDGEKFFVSGILPSLAVALRQCTDFHNCGEIPMRQHQDYLMRMIEQLSQALAGVLNRLLKGESAQSAAVDAELNDIASRAGIDLELAQAIVMENLLDLVSAGGAVDNCRCWLLAELLYLKALQSQQILDSNKAVENFARSLFLYRKVPNEDKDSFGLPAPDARREEIMGRMNEFPFGDPVDIDKMQQLLGLRRQ